MTSKQCFKCLCEKPLSEFYKHAYMADGHLNKCKDCTKQDTHARRHGPGREKVLAYDRERAKQPHRVEHMRRTIAKWQQEHPDRKKAHSKLWNALRSGAVTAWTVCAVPDCCSKPEAHHPDYANPLDVVWLCPAHHKQAHALTK